MAETVAKSKPEESLEIMNFRLTNIEKSITELKDVVLETKMQERDIKDLAKDQSEILRAINSHDQRIKKLETEPTQKKAERWQYILDYIFKAIVAGGVLFFLSKINFPT